MVILTGYFLMLERHKMKKTYIDAMNEYSEGESPGLWENIQKKKDREGKKYKPAKPGDPDRPDPEAYKKAQSS